MKQKLLFLVTLLFTFIAYSQVANQPEDYIVCDYDQDGLTEFNLTLVEPEVLGSQDPSNFTISYYLTLADADSGINPIANVNNYTNLSNPQTIFVRVEDMSTNGYATTNFNLVVDFVDLQSYYIRDVSCYGSNDAEITLNASGGIAPYQYKINNGAFQSSNVFTSLSAGVYDCFVVDSFGCSQYITVMIQEPEPISLSATLTEEILCTGDSSAEITLNASGGTEWLMYSIDYVTFQSSNVFSSLLPGTYDCMVQDINGCHQILSITIPPMALITVMVTVNDINCFGGASVEIMASGGVGPYQYSVNGFNFQNSNVFTSLSAGENQFFVRDSNGCMVEVSVTIDACLDSDSDGVADEQEDLNGNGNYDDDDTDLDTIPNYLDDDDDGDNVPTIVEINIPSGKIVKMPFVDTDLDAIANYLDDDDDGDMLLTIDEDYNNNGDPTDDDTDMSGTPDYLENNVTLSTGGDNIISSGFKFYPNPANTTINIQLNTTLKGRAVIEIVDIQGKAMFTKVMDNNLDALSLDVSKLQSGFYFLKLNNDNTETIKKLIIE